jgi:lipid-A-disaccharide synthase
LKPSILIVAGENSGEKYGASLVREFRKLDPSYSFFGIGGKQMAAQGVELVFPIEKLAVVGVFEVISHLPRIKKIFDRMKREVRLRKPSAAVLIDSPDFNLRLAKKLKRLSIPVLYYISPTVWAWREGRLRTIKKTVSRMMLIFPFEEKIYGEQGIPAVYVGHPLKERVKIDFSKEEFKKKHGLDPQKKLISLVPGSRKSEIKFHMPILARAIQLIKSEWDAEFILLLAQNLEKDFLLSFIPAELKEIRILSEDHYEALASSDFVLSACGTANLEAALLETPLLSFYRISPLTYFFGYKLARLAKIKNFSIVNILAAEKIIPELIQRNFSPENILAETKKILNDKEVISGMKAHFRQIKALLGENVASQNAALELDRLLKKREPDSAIYK